MPVIKIKVEGKIAKNLTPEVKIVCGNEDYTVEFEFDSTWQEENVKTGIVAFNGVAIRVPFKGNKLELPKLKKTNLCGIGVKTDDGKLQTTTPAYVECLYSAEDLTDEEIAAPTKDVYDQIIELINKTIIEANIPYDELPLMDGVAQAGESNNFARGDHRHPTDENLKAIAQNAQNLATTAQKSADLSVEKAESALQSAGLANETANSAKELSQTANANAQQALNTANNIDEIASSALNVANSAFERAIEVSETASQAQTLAESAKETAQNASAQVGTANANATLALNTANDAKTLGESAKQKANTALEQSNELKLQIPYFGTTLEMVLDQSTYLLTAKLFNKDGTVLSMQTVDLPLETMVVSGRYDYITKQIILTLKNGETISFPVVDLVDGIVSQDTFTAELSKKVDKISIANQLLGTDGSGNPTSYPLDSVGTKVLVDGVKVTEFNADEKANVADLSKVATSGSYNDLSDKPEILELGESEGTAYDGAKGKQNADLIATLPNAVDVSVDETTISLTVALSNKNGEVVSSKTVTLPSTDLSDYVKFTDKASDNKAGLLETYHNKYSSGIEFIDGKAKIYGALSTDIDSKKRDTLAITPKTNDHAVKVGITTNTETLTEEEKTSACEWLGAVKQSTSTSGWSLYGREGTNDKMFATIGSAHTAKIESGVIPRYNYNYNDTETEIGAVLLTGTPKHSYHAANKKYIDNLPDYLSLTDEQKAKWRALFGISESGGGGATETLKLYRVTGTLIETDGSSYAPCEFLFEATVKNNNEGLYEANTLTDLLTNSEVGLISFRVMHKTGQAIFPWGATVDTDMSTAIIYGISEGMVFYKTPDGSEHLMANISIEEI